jgi:nitroimidazol reductase NimA-like FMN-containing flavoprotein (pyridoxamine 5'-phosphate oxidase superfamily)
MTQVSPDADAVLRSSRIARVATVTLSGAPHAAPFWFHWDGERLTLDTLENPTVRNLHRHDRVTVLVHPDGPAPGSLAVALRGRALAHTEDEAPAAVLAGVEAIREDHADEIASPVFERYADQETRAPVYVEILPEGWSWVSIGSAGGGEP